MTDEPKPFPRAVENLIASFRGLPLDRGRSRVRPTRELGSVIEEQLIKYRIGRSSLEHIIREKWPEVVGEAHATYSHPVVLERGGRALVVLVSHSVVRNELFLHRAAILEKLRKIPGCSGIKELYLRAG
ncbi:MAG: DciA family protein [Opitutaceae bacterium]|nr:DciA family protein [Opitutaceae bacterium]